MRRHLLGTLGAHAEHSGDLMLGGMLQLDSVSGNLFGGIDEIRGSGWMAKPYLVVSGALGRIDFEVDCRL